MANDAHHGDRLHFQVGVGGSPGQEGFLPSSHLVSFLLSQL